MPLLADYLEEGLEKLGYSAEEIVGDVMCPLDRPAGPVPAGPVTASPADPQHACPADALDKTPARSAHPGTSESDVSDMIPARLEARQAQRIGYFELRIAHQWIGQSDPRCDLTLPLA